MVRERCFVLFLIAAFVFALAGCKKPPKPPTPASPTTPTTEEASRADGDRTLEDEALDVEDDDEDEDDALLP